MNLLQLVIVTAQISAVSIFALTLFWAWIWMNCLMWVPRQARRSGASSSHQGLLR